MKNFIGASLLGVGILIAGVSGLCTLAFLVGALFDGSLAGREQLAYLPAVFIVGAVPFAIGIGLFFLGRKLIRDAAPGPARDMQPQPPTGDEAR